MRSSLLARTLVLALLPAAFTSARAGNLNYTSNVHDESGTLTCSDFELRFWSDAGRDVVTTRRDRTLSLVANPSSPFRVAAADCGGVRVQPSPDGSFSAVLCMAAGAGSREEGERILDRLEIVNERGGLRVTGPSSNDWAAEIILSVPRGVSLDLSAENGPLSLRDVKGRFTLRTTNGPISVVDVDGVVDADAQNGPIKFKGHGGDVRLVTQNGPLKIQLDQGKWSGKGLAASTRNGPVRLMAPPGLTSGVEVRGSSHSPVKWDGELRSLGASEAGDRSFRLGEGPVVVRLSTVNGPIHISGPRRSARGTWI